MSQTIKTLTAGAMLAMSGSVLASQCETVRFSDVGWTDITATTAVATELVKGLGYQADTQLLSVPVTYTALAAGEIDVF